MWFSFYVVRVWIETMFFLLKITLCDSHQQVNREIYKILNLGKLCRWLDVKRKEVKYGPQHSYNQFSFLRLIVIKKVSSSTSHKKTTSLCLSVFTSIRLYENLWPNPTPNYFPKLCEQFSARFPLKGMGTVPSFALWRDTNFS